MDKIKLQTVYVRVLSEDRTPTDKIKTYHTLIGDRPETCSGDMIGLCSSFWLDKLPNRVVLTPQELQNLLREYLKALVGDQTTEQFLKSKGIEI